ncbi:ribose-phosphate pyrophosphokinase [Pichia californica]|uniref:ribose-phosphate diphosphokinase n=1 Tax=Pichia californica TaxID=460514 RepID=A0A9P7BF41_9ASCO|nr:ribose-phosphate pyrophosphokinase [[Candida] californica]KAG0690107.1 ribose-phosphate pyrophosphokinase [[Candida] californica]
MRDIVIFSGSSNEPLVQRICQNLSLPQGKVLCKKFANGETSVQLETSVREKDVFILQSGAGNVNDYLIELLLMISACKMASARRINVIMPLFFYSRQMDMPAVKAGEIIKAKTETTTESWIAQNGMLIANLLTSAGANHIITMDLHDSQYQGFFDIPVDNLYSKQLVQYYLANFIPKNGDCVIVSPDAGGAKRAAAIADSMSLSFALVHKERRIETNEDRSMLVGDVENKDCVIVDDLVDTAGTLIKSAKLLKCNGANDIYAIVTHGLFSGEALNRMIETKLFKKIVTSNSVDQTERKKASNGMLDVLDVSRMFGEAIRRINNGESVSVIYNAKI